MFADVLLTLHCRLEYRGLRDKPNKLDFANLIIFKIIHLILEISSKVYIWLK